MRPNLGRHFVRLLALHQLGNGHLLQLGTECLLAPAEAKRFLRLGEAGGFLRLGAGSYLRWIVGLDLYPIGIERVEPALVVVPCIQQLVGALVQFFHEELHVISPFDGLFVPGVPVSIFRSGRYLVEKDEDCQIDCIQHVGVNLGADDLVQLAQKLPLPLIQHEVVVQRIELLTHQARRADFAGERMSFSFVGLHVECLFFSWSAKKPSRAESVLFVMSG